MLADLVLEGARTLAFVRSRRGAELTALGAQRVLAGVDPELVGQVAAYRGGYLPEERRALESALQTGELLGVATTNALELGMDIAGLDAVVVAGFPGTRASFWQQSGRAGRARDEALVVLVARDDPMDTYLVHHPESLLGAPVEGCVLDPHNPYVLAPQLVCAAAELPLTERDVADVFGGPAAAGVLDELVARRCAAAPPHRLVLALDPGTAGRLGGHPGLGPRPGGAGRGRPPAGCSAPWTARRHRPPRTPARCTCTAARATWWSRWISTRGRPGPGGRPGLAHRCAQQRRRRGGAGAAAPRPRRGPGLVRRADGDLAGGRATSGAPRTARCSRRCRWTCPSRPCAPAGSGTTSTRRRCCVPG